MNTATRQSLHTLAIRTDQATGAVARLNALGGKWQVHVVNPTLAWDEGGDWESDWTDCEAANRIFAEMTKNYMSLS